MSELMTPQAVSLESDSLSDLASQINDQHAQATRHATTALEHAKHAGELLQQAKQQVSHGQWIGWLSDNCDVSPRQAQRYMKVADNWLAITKNDAASYLTIDEAAEAKKRQGTRTDIPETFPESSAGDSRDKAGERVGVSGKSIEIAVTKETEIVNDRKPYVSHNAGDNEWYSPADYVAAGREVLGVIDLDPASSIEANKVIQASQIYTAADDGLEQSWCGTVWLNPPYANPLCAQFIEKLVDDYSMGNVREAVVLVNNATETAWFQMATRASSAVCFPDKRVRFWKSDGTQSQPLQGQAVFYFGSDTDKFSKTFCKFGEVLGRIGGAS